MVLVAREGEWRHLLSRFRLHHVKDEEGYGGGYRRTVMLQNASVVGEKIVKVAQSYVKTKLMDVVKETMDKLPPDMLQEKSRNEVYRTLLQFDEVNFWNKAQNHMEVNVDLCAPAVALFSCSDRSRSCFNAFTV